MLLLRHPTKATPNSISPPLTGGSISGGRPLNLVTHQHPFHRQMVETSPRETLPVSPRPVSLPPSPPSNSGPRRQQTPHDTQETLWSPTSEEYVPSKPSRIIPIPTSSVSPASGPPFPMRFRQPASGGGAGGFALIPSSHHKSNHDNFRHNTTDSTHWPDPKFATHSDSNSPRSEIPGISEGPRELYERRLDKWSIELDTLLIFVSLVVKGDQ